EIAAKFGQYQDFPDDLERYGAMKGLSKEWTQRYWAAHWALPSPQQGFEMLHRGVIDNSELNMLLRQDPDLSILEQELKKIGVHPNYTNIYKTLAYQIPPVADIITMAVREAFTPEIAAKFGQYQDFPDDLERYGAMKGLSKEWTQRYWAAHWALPSPQ
ncbi:unnamed protein product, partial [marine sediment metagenome]